MIVINIVRNIEGCMLEIGLGNKPIKPNVDKLHDENDHRVLPHHVALVSVSYFLHEKLGEDLNEKVDADNNSNDECLDDIEKNHVLKVILAQIVFLFINLQIHWQGLAVALVLSLSLAVEC